MNGNQSFEIFQNSSLRSYGQENLLEDADQRRSIISVYGLCKGNALAANRQYKLRFSDRRQTSIFLPISWVRGFKIVEDVHINSIP